MKPILVQQNSNKTLWWVIDAFVRTKLDSDGIGRPSTCWKLLGVHADLVGNGTRIDWPDKYTIISDT